MFLILCFVAVPYMFFQVFHLDKILEGMALTREEFVDLCILLGCDYCATIRGIGPKKAVELIKQYKSIEKVCVVCFHIEVLVFFRSSKIWTQANIRFLIRGHTLRRVVCSTIQTCCRVQRCN